MNTKMLHKEPIWKPEEASERRLEKFMNYIEKKYHMKFSSYWDFQQWTVNNIPKIWEEIWNSFGVIYSKSFDQVVNLDIPLEDSPKWFEGAKLNIAENLLKFRDNHVAFIVAEGFYSSHSVTYEELHEETEMYAASIKKLGVKKGDVVACCMSNRIEAVYAMLATTSIGAIWCSIPPTLEPKAFISLMEPIKPKLLFTMKRCWYQGNMIELLESIKEIADGLPSLKKVIIIPTTRHSMLEKINHIKNSCYLLHMLQFGRVPKLKFKQVTFSHPVFINFSFETSGVPKTITHGCGGLLSGIRDLMIHLNCQRTDIWFSMSQIGDVSWNTLMCLLFSGSTIVLHDGNVFYDYPNHNLWDMVDKLKVTTLCLTPSVLDEMEAKNCVPAEDHNFESLKSIMTCGSVVKSHHYEFVMKLKKELKIRIGHISTEIMEFCMVCEPNLPTDDQEISSTSLGTSIECYDEKGNPILGEIGELVIKKPTPSLPLGFWGDSDNVLYKKTYFSRFPGSFAVGDAILIDQETKGITLCGRSDEIIKQHGCRFRSLEIYNVVKKLPEVRDSLCVGQQNKEGKERALLFLLMKDGHSFSEEIVQKLRRLISEELSVNHVPDVITETSGIPYNAYGKKEETVVKKIVNKMPYNTDTVSNSECLKYYCKVKLGDF